MGNKWRNQREQIKVRLAVSGRIDRCLGPWKKCLVESFQPHPIAKVPGIEENDQRHSEQSRPDSMPNRDPRSALQAVSFWCWRGVAGNALARNTRICNALAGNALDCNARVCSSRAGNVRVLPATPLQRQSTQYQNQTACNAERGEMNDIGFFCQNHSGQTQNESPKIPRFSGGRDSEDAPEGDNQKQDQPRFVNRVAIIKNKPGRNRHPKCSQTTNSSAQEWPEQDDPE